MSQLDFADRIRQLAAQIAKQIDLLKTEEATKTTLVLPFIQALGYNIFDPSEVTPELVADVGIKKGEKVDYAILRDGKPIMLFECKGPKSNLSEAHASQLYRYFTTTTVRFGILTNGVEYRFFSDLEKPNRMDDKPFLVVDLHTITDTEIEALKKFTKPVFNVDFILTTASELKYTRAIKQVMIGWLTNPGDDIVRLLTGHVYDGLKTQTVIQQFNDFVKRAFQGVINEQIDERLKSALQNSPKSEPEPEPELSPIEVSVSRTVTTQDETDAFLVIKAILREIVDVGRIAMRDTVSYCGILLDDNNRKPICRLYFTPTRKTVGFLNLQRQEEKIVIEKIDDLYRHVDRLKAAISSYETSGVT